MLCKTVNSSIAVGCAPDVQRKVALVVGPLEVSVHGRLVHKAGAGRRGRGRRHRFKRAHNCNLAEGAAHQAASLVPPTYMLPECEGTQPRGGSERQEVMGAVEAAEDTQQRGGAGRVAVPATDLPPWAPNSNHLSIRARRTLEILRSPWHHGSLVPHAMCRTLSPRAQL